MKFSGHETFHIREGWLHKGLQLVQKDPENFENRYVHDFLGVGSNMAKSIKHWLVTLGLVVRENKEERPSLTTLGRAIIKKDPHLLHPLTWWVLHVNLVFNSNGATSWHWFYNSFYQPRFDRKLCVETLRRHLLSQGCKLPSWQTMDRDISCLLSTYARTIPEDPGADPEESYDCPFQELGLLKFFRETGFYQFASPMELVPPEALGYVLSKAFPGEVPGKHSTVSLTEAATALNSPGKCFIMTMSELFEVVERATAKIGEDEIAISGLAASRMIRFRYHSPDEWVAKGLEVLR